MPETPEDEMPPPIDAATVVVARDTQDSIEVLMLRKNSKIHFGGMWVFPGGRVDEEDHSVADGNFGEFRTAAVREAHEEAGIDLSGSDLVHFSHWLPPAIRPKRFSTQFFITKAPHGIADIAIDHGEITEHAWISPADAFRRRESGEIEFVTPTFVTLDWLARFERVDDALADVVEPVCFHTNIVRVRGDDPGNVALYDGDAGYHTGDINVPGGRRRLYMLESRWWWEERL